MEPHSLYVPSILVKVLAKSEGERTFGISARHARWCGRGPRCVTFRNQIIDTVEVSGITVAEEVKAELKLFEVALRPQLKYREGRKS